MLKFSDVRYQTKLFQIIIYYFITDDVAMSFTMRISLL
ncbi:Hypothetical protein EAG7_00772 [Klebsiella aerogenes]|nr:Hypothetical protein EAG7_00772 [Klebsiella aerogenes]PVF73712.1 hypothetical protein CSC18_2162 [Klebsiella aerogenes]CCG29329.1 hypothetical protein [Klebsiella aerogenes EA1509E]